MKHEEFLNKLRELAEITLMPNPDVGDIIRFEEAASVSTVLKLIAIIEKLKEQRNDLDDCLKYVYRYDKELDEIVGMG